MNRMWMMWARSGLESCTDSGTKRTLRDSRLGPIGHRERGSVLLAAIFILIILAAIAVGATSSSVMESRMSANSIDQDAAFQSAEFALRAGEFAISGAAATPPVQPGCNPAPPPASPISNCVAALGSDTGAGIFVNGTGPWGSVQAATVVGMANPANPHAPSANPEVVVEHMAFVRDKLSGSGTKKGQHFYRITARGTAGPNNNAQAIVQSVFARQT